MSRYKSDCSKNLKNVRNLVKKIASHYKDDDEIQIWIEKDVKNNIYVIRSNIKLIGK